MHYTTLELTAGSLKNLFAIMSIEGHLTHTVPGDRERLTELCHGACLRKEERANARKATVSACYH